MRHLRHGLIYSLCLVWSFGNSAPAADRSAISDSWQPYVITQRDQGQLGTCHAFACLPPLDFLENSRIPTGSKQMSWVTSENWVVFLAVVGKICSPSDNDVKINQGGSAAQNMSMVLKYGYCEQSSYSQYEKDDKERSLSKGTTLAELHDDFEPPPPGAKGTYAPGLEKRFEESFGVTVAEARTLCGAKDPVKAMQLLAGQAASRARLTSDEKTKRRSLAFNACATQALEKRKQLVDAKCEFVQGDPDKMTAAQKITELKKLIRDHAPVNVSMKNYPDGNPPSDGKHGFHAFTFVGFDDADKKFIVQNSWGKGNNRPVKYDVVDNVTCWGYLSCPGKKFPPSPRERRSFIKGLTDGTISEPGGSH